MKNYLNKILIIFCTLFFLSNVGFTQINIGLWSQKDIEQNEEDLTSAYKKYFKNQNNKNRKESFLDLFSQQVKFHKNQLENLDKDLEKNKDWVALINRIASLQYIYNLTAELLVENDIEPENYNTKLDSVKLKAVNILYDKGKIAINDKKMARNLAVAYRSLSIVQALHPGYESTSTYLELLRSQGDKTGFIEPLKFSNQGNYINVQLGGSSSLGEYISAKTIKSLSDKTVGFKLQKAPNSNTSYNIKCDFNIINFGNANAIKTTYTRTNTVKDNKVTATVNYNTDRIPVNGAFEVVIVDNASKAILAKTTFKMADVIEYVTATYTGDKDALTYEDNQAINRTSNESLSSFRVKQITVLYDKNIHNKLCDFINDVLGW